MPDAEGSAKRVEAIVAAEVAAMTAGMPIGAEFAVASSARICPALEYFIPQLLCRTFPEWKGESLDGFFIARARKTGPRAVELVGTCILITDQAVTPFMLTLESSPSRDSVTSHRVHLGERGRGPLGISVADCNSTKAARLLETLVARLDRVSWTYMIAGDADRR